MLPRYRRAPARLDDGAPPHLEEQQRSCFGTDVDCGRLGHQLHLVDDAVRTMLPEGRQVTLPSDDSRINLRSTMKQDRLNNCLLMHCHKSITDALDIVKMAKRFACANELRKGHFGKFE